MMNLSLGRFLDWICLILIIADSVDWLLNYKNVLEFNSFLFYILEEKSRFGKLNIYTKELIRIPRKSRVEMLR